MMNWGTDELRNCGIDESGKLMNWGTDEEEN
jgi:hypothetical protein